MRTAGQALYVGEGAPVPYNSVYPSQQQYGGPRPPGHMVVAQQGARTDAGPGPMKGGAKVSMFAAQQQQQRSAPYPNPHRYMQSRRPQFINGQTAEVIDQIPMQIRMRLWRSFVCSFLTLLMLHSCH